MVAVASKRSRVLSAKFTRTEAPEVDRSSWQGAPGNSTRKRRRPKLQLRPKPASGDRVEIFPITGLRECALRQSSPPAPIEMPAASRRRSIRSTIPSTGGPIGAERHANTDLLRLAHDGIGNHAEHAYSHQYHADPGKYTKKRLEPGCLLHRLGLQRAGIGSIRLGSSPIALRTRPLAIWGILGSLYEGFCGFGYLMHRASGRFCRRTGMSCHWRLLSFCSAYGFCLED
jgi:hypothetical protein